MKIYNPDARTGAAQAQQPYFQAALKLYRKHADGLTDEELGSLLGIKLSSARWCRYRLQQEGFLQLLAGTRQLPGKAPLRLFAVTPSGTLKQKGMSVR